MSTSFVDADGTTRFRGTLAGAGAPSSLSVARQVTNTEILNLQATDIEVIDAPGAGKAIFVSQLVCVLDTRNGAYTADIDQELDVGYAGHWVNVSANISGPITDAALTAGVWTPDSGTDIFALFGQGSGSVAWDMALVDGLPFCVGNIGTVELGGGGEGNSLSLKVTYSVVPTTPFAS